MEDDGGLGWLRHWHQRARLARRVHQLEDFCRWRSRAPAHEGNEPARVPVPEMAASSEPTTATAHGVSGTVEGMTLTVDETGRLTRTRPVSSGCE